MGEFEEAIRFARNTEAISTALVQVAAHAARRCGVISGPEYIHPKLHLRANKLSASRGLY